MTDRIGTIAVARFWKRAASVFASRLVLALVPMLLAACSGKTSDPAGASREEPIPECVQYADQLRACLTSIGAPDPEMRASAALKATTAKDEAQRLQAKESCARDLVRLRTSCR